MKTGIYFYDNYWLDTMKNMHRRFFPPKLISTFEDGAYPSVAWCPEVGKYRLWYEILPEMGNDSLRHLVCVESSDAISWEKVKPEYGERFSGKQPGVVYTGNGGLHGTAVYRDPYEKDPSMLYKACGMTRTFSASKENRANPVIISTSPDGLNWTERMDFLVHPYTSDAYNCLFYNPVTSSYSVMLRAAYVDRRIFLAGSEDLVNWSKPRLVLHPDSTCSEAVYSVQYYSMWAGWFDGVFLGLLWRYYVSLQEEDYTTLNGFMDTELVYSYDGECWIHTTERPLVERPVPPGQGHAQICLSGITGSKEGDRHILIGRGTRIMHARAEMYKGLYDAYGKSEPLGGLNLYEIRKNGYCGLENCGMGGLVTTKSFELTEDDLTLNISVPYGFCRCAVLTHEGVPYEGFSMDNSIPFTGDGLEVKPRWKGCDISQLKGKRCRFSIEVNTGVLYSINGTLRPYIRRRQISLNDPMQMEP